jgi:predicted Zn-dependent protease
MTSIRSQRESFQFNLLLPLLGGLLSCAPLAVCQPFPPSTDPQDAAPRSGEETRSIASQAQSSLLALIRASVANGKISEALGYADQLSRSRPKSSKLEIQVGLMLLEAQQWSVAEAHFRAAASADQAARSELVALAEQAFDDGKYQGALCLLDSVNALLPPTASRYSMIGACYYHLQNPAQAVNAVQEAIRLEPGNEDYYIQLAQIFLDYNTPAPAISLLEHAKTRFPSSKRMGFALGVAYLKNSEFGEARKQLEESRLARSSDPLPLHALAVLYEGTSDWDRLRPIGQQLATVAGYEFEGYYYQAEADYYIFQGQAGRNSRIKEMLQESARLDANYAPSRVLLGKLLIETGADLEAVDSLQRAIALDPNLAGAYYSLSIAYHKLGDFRRSSEAMEKFHQVEQANKASEKSLSYKTSLAAGSTNR